MHIMIYYRKNKPFLNKFQRGGIAKGSGNEIDWKAVREVNDSGYTQAAKIFDPTGISSYPDVYYSIKDYKSGNGSLSDVGLNILGALPIIGKAKTLFKLAKLGSATKAVSSSKRGIELVRTIAAGANKVSGAPIQLARPYISSSNVLARGAAKTAVFAERVGTSLAKPFSPRVTRLSTKVNDISDYKNLAVDLTDTSNFIHDVDSSIKGFMPNKGSIIDRNKAIVYSNNINNTDE